MAVDETWGHHLAFGVDDAISLLSDPTEPDDSAVSHPYVGPLARASGAIQHGPIADHQIVRH
jgi:hypothetical protein